MLYEELNRDPAEDMDDGYAHELPESEEPLNLAAVKTAVKTLTDEIEAAKKAAEEEASRPPTVEDSGELETGFVEPPDDQDDCSFGGDEDVAPY